MKNTIVKTLIYDNQVRLFFANNTELINKILTKNTNIHSIHKQMLGKTISVISILTGTLKGEQRISLQITLSEPKYKIFADADAKGNVRGYLNDALLHAPMQHDTSFADLIGSKGTIRVVKGSAMNQFIGITDMPYQNIIDDISHYFIQSEQTQTYIAANIGFTNDNNVQFSNAIYAQLLPGAAPDLITKVKDTIHTNQEFFTTLNENNLDKKLSKIFEDIKIIGYSPVQFFCGCSKEMFYGMLHSLSQNELQQIVANKETIDTTCHICGSMYHFHHHEIQGLLK